MRINITILHFFSIWDYFHYQWKSSYSALQCRGLSNLYTTPTLLGYAFCLECAFLLFGVDFPWIYFAFIYTVFSSGYNWIWLVQNIAEYFQRQIFLLLFCCTLYILVFIDLKAFYDANFDLVPCTIILAMRRIISPYSQTSFPTL